MSRVRRSFSREFKIRVVREVEGGTSAAEIARQYGIHPNLIYKWSRQHCEDPEGSFLRGAAYSVSDASAKSRIAELENMVGRLTMEKEFLKKALKRLESFGPVKSLNNGRG